MKGYYQISYPSDLGAQALMLELNKATADFDFSAKEKQISGLLNKLKAGEYIDAQYLQNALFPHIGNKFFISHSHSERNIALRVAHKLGINNCFIDSLYWASADKCLVNIQQSLCKRHRDHLELPCCNRMAAHFYGMLSVAIQNTIAQSQAFIYIPPQRSFMQNGKTYQSSPWLYQELAFARNLHDIEGGLVKQGMLAENFSDTIVYPTDLDFLQTLNFDDLGSIL